MATKSSKSKNSELARSPKKSQKNKTSNSELLKKIASRTAVVGVIGLGYVGLPLTVAFAKAGFPVLGYDMDEKKAKAVNAGKSYIKHITPADVKSIKQNGGHATASSPELKNADAILICVPTPLNRHREPDLKYIINTAVMLAKTVRPGQLIVLESTSFPGATRETVLPALESTGLVAGRDFFLAYSPEREDPGGQGHSAAEIPKLVGGLTPACLEAAVQLYSAVVPSTAAVKTPEVAEAAKLLENIFRSVNIALVNELKIVFDRMGIDIWDVIAAAKTKPFGFMPFYPGPGLGGHCIPIDPFYLTWKARQYECSTRFIELAGEINVAMPEYVVSKTADALNCEKKSLNGSKLLLIGAAYKKDVDDIRESPSLRLLELFGKSGATVDYHDPFIPVLPKTRRYNFKLQSIDLNEKTVAQYDAVIIATDHTEVDYDVISKAARIVVDTRNIMAQHNAGKARVIKA